MVVDRDEVLESRSGGWQLTSSEMDRVNVKGSLFDYPGQEENLVRSNIQRAYPSGNQYIWWRPGWWRSDDVLHRPSQYP